MSCSVAARFLGRLPVLPTAIRGLCGARKQRSVPIGAAGPAARPWEDPPTFELRPSVAAPCCRGDVEPERD